MIAKDSIWDDACPFIDQDDPRCSKQFSLNRLRDAFHVCLGGHHACPVYYALRYEQSRRTNQRTDVIAHVAGERQVDFCELTVQGQSVRKMAG